MLTHPPPEKSARIREITPRSVIVGLLVALVIGASYPYVVLKFGFGPNISVVSDILAAEPGSGFDVHLTRMQTFVWLSIEDENLPFPDGIAAGETLIMLDSRGDQARTSAFMMFGALGLSGLTFLATQLRWVVDNIPLAVNAFSARVGLGFGVSMLSIGSGMIFLGAAADSIWAKT